MDSSIRSHVVGIRGRRSRSGSCVEGVTISRRGVGVVVFLVFSAGGGAGSERRKMGWEDILLLVFVVLWCWRIGEGAVHFRH